MTDAALSNPLLAASPLPYGLPDYRAIRPEHYLPAFTEAFARHRREIDAITNVAAAPTFENSLVPLERSGELLHDVASAFYTVSSADATPEIQEIEEALAPLMAAHTDAVQLNPELYRRIASVHAQLDDLNLAPEDRYLVERHYREMTHAGAGLDEAQKARLTEINGRLSILTTTFEKNLLNDTNDLAVLFDDVTELDGLTEGELSAAASSCRSRHHGGLADLAHPVHRTPVPGFPAQSPVTRENHGGIPRSWYPRQRQRQSPCTTRDRAAASRAR